MQRLQAGCRAAGIEVMYTLIRNLTKDGRDRSLDYKITGFSVPPGSWDGEVIDAIKPLDDEIVIPKTASNVFCSTNIDYILQQSRHAVSGDQRRRDRPVRGGRGRDRLRPRLSRHARHRCLCHRHKSATRIRCARSRAIAGSARRTSSWPRLGRCQKPQRESLALAPKVSPRECDPPCRCAVFSP